MTNKRATLTLILAALLVMFLACPVWAKVSGPCANCHTMHNSQQGSMVNENDPGPSSQKLLNTDCVGCHTATDGTTWKNSIDAPIVYNTSEPQYGADAGDGKKQGLAGGNFY